MGGRVLECGVRQLELITDEQPSGAAEQALATPFLKREVDDHPLNLTAGVIAVATLAWQSSKAAYDVVDRLIEAPNAIADSKRLLSQTQNTLDTLTDTLTAGTETPGVLDSVLRKIKLDIALESTQCLCDEFRKTITKYTSHSTKLKFSSRDRFTVNLHESKITKFNKQLSEYQQTISLVLMSINLIFSSRTSEDIERLSDRFTAQETALVNLEKRLRDDQTSLQAISRAESDDKAKDGSLSERDESLQLTAGLQKVCQDALSATRAKRTGQNFGGMQTDDHSAAMQGIVGTAQRGVEQSFGNMTTKNYSKAFQGQMDAASFALMYGK